MKFLKYTFLAAALMLALVFPAAAQDALSPGDVVEAQLTEESAEYTFSASAGDIIDISLASEDFDALLKIDDADGNELASNDDSDGSDSRLLFVVPEDGEYTVVATSYDGSGSGSYTLITSVIETQTIGYGDTVELTTDGTATMYVSFEGEAGDVINLFGISANEEDIRIELNGDDGTELTYDDDSGSGVNPYIRRYILPTSGSYLVEVKPSYENELSGTVELTLEKTELITLGDAPETLTLGEEIDQEVYRFEAEAGTSYRVTVKAASGEDDLSLSVDILQGESFAQSSMSSTSVSGMSIDFSPDESGTVEVKVRGYFFFDSELTLSVSVQEVA